MRMSFLENHLHLILQTAQLSKAIGMFKSYTALQIVRNLEVQNTIWILEQLGFYKKRHKTDRNHQVWEEGSHPEEIQGLEMMKQKIEYIHGNPIKRGYVDQAIDWRYSSARNYAGKDGLLPICTQW